MTAMTIHMYMCTLDYNAIRCIISVYLLLHLVFNRSSIFVSNFDNFITLVYTHEATGSEKTILATS